MEQLAVNPIEQTYRDLLAQGETVLKLFSANPIEEEICFPADILAQAYGRYFKHLNTQIPNTKKVSFEPTFLFNKQLSKTISNC